MRKFKYSSLFKFEKDVTEYDFISNEGIAKKSLIIKMS